MEELQNCFTTKRITYGDEDGNFISIGSDALDILEGLDFEDESQRGDIDIVMKNLEEYCVVETNEIYEWYCFNKRDQEVDEAICDRALCDRASKVGQDMQFWNSGK